MTKICSNCVNSETQPEQQGLICIVEARHHRKKPRAVLAGDTCPKFRPSPAQVAQFTVHPDFVLDALENAYADGHISASAAWRAYMIALMGPFAPLPAVLTRFHNVNRTAAHSLAAVNVFKCQFNKAMAKAGGLRLYSYVKGVPKPEQGMYFCLVDGAGEQL